MSHTPGPWHRNIKPASKYAVVYAGRNTHVAVVCSQGLTEEETEGNCDLIAAAPELLAALKALAPEARREHDAGDGHFSTAEIEAMERAIRKAEGTA